MANVLVEEQVRSVSVDQLRQELSLLSLAGFGGAMIDFRTPSNGFCNTVTLKVFKPIGDD